MCRGIGEVRVALTEKDLGWLLSRGVDDRNTPRLAGLTKYETSFEPRADCLQFGSCTASNTSVRSWLVQAEGLSKYSDRKAALEDFGSPDTFTTIRKTLQGLLEPVDARWPFGTEVALSPSGTDAETLVVLLAALVTKLPIANIMLGPDEIGSGSTTAAMGRAFTERCPDGSRLQLGDALDPMLADRVTVHSVPLRTPDGSPIPMDVIDDEVCRMAGHLVRAGRFVILHVNASSKTGIGGPSLAAAGAVARSHPGQVMPVLDAAQGRFSRQGIARALHSNSVVMLTGSKFFQAPPFCAALLIPRRWYEAISRDHPPYALRGFWAGNFLPTRMARGITQAHRQEWTAGLAARWLNALDQMKVYYGIPEEVRHRVLRSFAPTALHVFEQIPRVVVVPEAPITGAKERLLFSHRTIIAIRIQSKFGSAMSLDQLRDVRSRLLDLPSGKVLFGQPVTVGSEDHSESWLRVAVGANQVIESAGSNHKDPLAGLRHDMEAAAHSLQLVLEQQSG